MVVSAWSPAGVVPVPTTQNLAPIIGQETWVACFEKPLAQKCQLADGWTKRRGSRRLIGVPEPLRVHGFFFFFWPQQSAKHSKRNVYKRALRGFSGEPCSREDDHIPTLQMAKWGSESFSNSTKITQLVNGRYGIELRSNSKTQAVASDIQITDIQITPKGWDVWVHFMIRKKKNPPVPFRNNVHYLGFFRNFLGENLWFKIEKPFIQSQTTLFSPLLLTIALMQCWLLWKSLSSWTAVLAKCKKIAKAWSYAYWTIVPIAPLPEAACV